MSNVPAIGTNYWGIIVLQTRANYTSYVVQLASQEDTTNLYIRRKHNSTWTSWEKIYPANTLHFYDILEMPGPNSIVSLSSSAAYPRLIYRSSMNNTQGLPLEISGVNSGLFMLLLPSGYQKVIALATGDEYYITSPSISWKKISGEGHYS